MIVRGVGVLGLLVVLCTCNGKGTTAPDDTSDAPLVVISIDSVATLGGRNVDVHIRLQYPGDPEQTLAELSAFDLLLNYDSTVLVFQNVKKGPALSEWERFTWRTGLFGGGPSAPHLFRLIANREMNNGVSPDPPQYYPEGIIATATFYVSGDLEFTGTCASVGFALYECNDNVLLPETNDTAYFAIPDTVSLEIGEAYDPVACSTSTNSGYGHVRPHVIEQTIELRPGKICILTPPDDRYAGRGDLDLNGVAFEEGDCGLLERFLLEGHRVWERWLDGLQIAASDCNGDGVLLTVADHEFCNRVLRGEAEVDDSVSNSFVDTVSFWITQVDSVWYGYLGQAESGVSALWFEIANTGGGAITVERAEGMDFSLGMVQKSNITRVLITDWEHGIPVASEPDRPILILRPVGTGIPNLRSVQASHAPGVALHVEFGVLSGP